jgi:hypothetical protein
LVGRLWFSTADNNTTNPDATTSANWTVLPGTNAAGTPVPSLSTTAPPNTVPANGLTIGNAASNATSRANADTYWLFVFMWTNCPNTQCQLFNSSGGAILRGGSANADFAANTAIATFNMNGAALMGADSQAGTTTSFLSGVPVMSGSRTVPGSILGENLHSLTAAENGAHTHANTLTDPGHSHSYTAPAVGVGTGTSPNYFSSSTTPGTTGVSTTGITINNASSGSGTGHNTVPRSVLAYWNLAL